MKNYVKKSRDKSAIDGLFASNICIELILYDSLCVSVILPLYLCIFISLCVFLSLPFDPSCSSFFLLLSPTSPSHWFFSTWQTRQPVGFLIYILSCYQSQQKKITSLACLIFLVKGRQQFVGCNSKLHIYLLTLLFSSIM